MEQMDYFSRLAFKRSFIINPYNLAGMRIDAEVRQ
jgi:hypothetical protein